MSIHDRISELVQEGKLLEFTPVLFAEDAYKRTILLPPSLYKLFHEDTNEHDKNNRLIKVRASLGRFVLGEPVDNFDYMKKLHKPPYDVWEIRVLDALPPLRVFGAFAAPDVFVCTHVEFRGKLGSFQSQEWITEKQNTEQTWMSLFPGFPRFKANHFNSYVTINGQHYDWNHKNK